MIDDTVLETLERNQFEYIKSLGKGGFSSVHLVHSLKYNIDFALKITSMSKAKEAEAEFRMLSLLSHPNIIRFYQYFSDSKYFYIILEYCPRGTLRDLYKSGMSSSEVDLRTKELISALNFCHVKKVAHRDIKPDNILVDTHGRLKIADFGIASQFTETIDIITDKGIQQQCTLVSPKKEICQTFGGSRSYMAPEVLGFLDHDPFKADIWSLGVTLYEMAMGKLPWTQTEAMKLKLKISTGIIAFGRLRFSPKFKELVNLMLIPNPIKRISIKECVQLFNNDQSLKISSSYCLPRPSFKINISKSERISMFRNIKFNTTGDSFQNHLSSHRQTNNIHTCEGEHDANINSPLVPNSTGGENNFLPEGNNNDSNYNEINNNKVVMGNNTNIHNNDDNPNISVRGSSRPPEIVKPKIKGLMKNVL